ncbi:multidrug efflux SMR transporter [Nocardia sp. XZ_19_385]|uniref:DMT family transporter n=1 Tax=Nocardia sp. XZ_19_385 TaxID=2769488 RepID=UPI00188E19FC|nr:multidrug efflux SMR transporter [Nocardia sp. XZ_19_385]
MAWVALIIAGLVETVYAAALERSATFTRLWPTLVFLAGVSVSMLGLAIAVRTIPIGTAYAVWVGIGAVGTAIYGIAVLDEPATAARLGCLLLIIAGVAGLKLLH